MADLPQWLDVRAGIDARRRDGRSFAGPRAAQVTLAASGALPVTLIAVVAAGVGNLRGLAIDVLFPGLVVTALIAGRTRALWPVVGRAMVAGLAATALYDVFRLGLVWFGLIPRDPFPHLGVLLGLHPGWVFGYLWRYVGDGAGLAVTFVILGGRGVARGVVFGLGVCAGLLGTLALCPYGQAMLFSLTPATVLMATVGHVIYGAVLGAQSARIETAGRFRILGPHRKT